MDNFVRGIDFIYKNIVTCIHDYIEDKSYDELIPPLQILFQIILHDGEY